MNNSKYTQAYIYGIYCNTTNELYIGSTYLTKESRLRKHLTDLNGYIGVNKKHRNYRSSFEVLFNNNYQMEIIELFPCNTKEELEIQESKHILKNRMLNNKVVNIRLARKLDKDYTLDDLSDLPCPSFI